MAETSNSTGPSSGWAAASKPIDASRTSSSEVSDRRTRPRSVLWAMASPHNLTTAGRPTERAASTAASGSPTVAQSDTGIPTLATIWRERASESVQVPCPVGSPIPFSVIPQGR